MNILNDNEWVQVVRGNNVADILGIFIWDSQSRRKRVGIHRAQQSKPLGDNFFFWVIFV